MKRQGHITVNQNTEEKAEMLGTFVASQEELLNTDRNVHIKNFLGVLPKYQEDFRSIEKTDHHLIPSVIHQILGNIVVYPEM